ncbi:MAG: phosphoribosylamine--glycine ligase [Saprospiraceae bacterium]|nr:phosphoribosylamine--glycine ligase [Saprospiraceae bacterium]
MNVLIIGNGGREHALAWKISQSPLCGNLFIAPGNAGTQLHGTNVAIPPSNFSEIGAFALSNNIDLIVVGPEAPLVDGIVDYFLDRPDLKNIPVIGPAADAAQLEGSKGFAKAFMEDYDIPTAAYREFDVDSLQEGLAYIEEQTPPIVLKADGLAAGKGVLICGSHEEAKLELIEMLGGKFGGASARVVIEEFLSGIEFSVFVMTDGENYVRLPVAKDYKRIGEGDTGLNTGGMGAVSPVSFVDETLMEKVEDRIIIPTIKGIQTSNLNYKGFIFFGLISVDQDPFVIEYNCRLGDPETEVILPRLKSDLLVHLQELAAGKLGTTPVEIEGKAATTVMLVSGGYPEAYEKGKQITGLENVVGSIPFHAGTLEEQGQILTNGGRVIALTSLGKNFREALKVSQQNADVVQFEGKYFRKDIGFDL